LEPNKKEVSLMPINKITVIFSAICMLLVSKLIFAYDLAPPCPPASAFSHVKGEQWKLAESYHWGWAMPDFEPDDRSITKLPAGGRASVSIKTNFGGYVICAYKTNYNYTVEAVYKEMDIDKNDLDDTISKNPNFSYTGKHSGYPYEDTIVCHASSARVNIDCKY